MSTLSMLIVTYVIKYLGEFDFIFDTVLDYGSGDQMGTFDAKTRHRRSHAWAPVKKEKEGTISILSSVLIWPRYKNALQEFMQQYIVHILVLIF